MGHFQRVVIFLLLVLMLSVRTSFAEMTTNVSIICDATQDILIIVYDAPIRSDRISVDATIKTYNLHDYVIYKKEEPSLSSGGYYVDKVKKIKYNCKLKSRNYDVYIEPYIYNNNPMGQCGADISCSVVIKEGKRYIVQEKYLELSCPPGSSFKKINEILISGENSKVNIKRKEEKE